MGRKNLKKEKGAPFCRMSPVTSAPTFRVQAQLVVFDAKGEAILSAAPVFEKQSPISYVDMAWEIANGVFAALDEMLHKRPDVQVLPREEAEVSKYDALADPLHRYWERKEQEKAEIREEDIPF